MPLQKNSAQLISRYTQLNKIPTEFTYNRLNSSDVFLVQKKVQKFSLK